MSGDRAMAFEYGSRKAVYILPLLGFLVFYGSYAILAYPFPENLLLLGVPVGLLVFLLCDWRLGIVIWYFTSALGNSLEIHLPGLPGLRPAHLGLLLLLVAWFLKSYERLFSAFISFLGTPKNRILLALAGWITLSMVMARLEGVPQMSIGYQINAWIVIVLVVLLVLVVSSNMDDRLVKTMVWMTVAYNIIPVAFKIGLVLTSGVGFSEWKAFHASFYQPGAPSLPVESYGSPLFVALIFFRGQRGWAKVLFGAGIVVFVGYPLLLAIGGFRSDTLLLVSTVGALLLFTRGRRLLAVTLIAVLPLAALNASTIQRWITEETEGAVTRRGVSIGKGSRLNLAEDAIQIIGRHPWWGTGSDFYRLHSDLKLVYPENVVKPAATPHNSWLQVAADSGIPALFLLLVLCGYMLRDALRLLRSSPDGLSRKYALFFLCVLSLAIVNSFISSGQILPVFTGVEGNETELLAPSLLNFWFYYALFLGFENRNPGRGTVASPRTRGKLSSSVGLATNV